MHIEDLGRRVAAIRWFDTIDLGAGIVTPGLDDSAGKLSTLGLPQDLRGKSVLDLCAWNGFFSFAAEQRGAARVLAVDHFCWNGPGWGTKEGFDLAREALGSNVEDLEVDVLDVTPENAGRFDVVLFLGVLYHMRHPLLALERVAAVTSDMLILETHVDATCIDRPMMAFYPGSELNGDPTNWCGPNEACVIGMLRAVGFREGRVHWRNYDAAGAKRGSPEGVYGHRAVFHAWK
ncbi:MAG TPA: DUF1698 domain-containing protein [Dokdonella sp.]|nr:DUF1698 domain-containing protein [Dokdonella sp.]